MENDKVCNSRAKGCRLTEAGGKKLAQALTPKGGKRRSFDSFPVDVRTVRSIYARRLFVNLSSIEALFEELELRLEPADYEKRADLEHGADRNERESERAPGSFTAPCDSALLDAEPVGGGMPPDSPYYVTRPSDTIVQPAVKRQDCIVRIAGPRQTGKTSLLARTLAQARRDQALVVITDFQSLDARDLMTIESFYLALAQQFYKAAKTGPPPTEFWDAHLSANTNFHNYLEEAILEATARSVVWGIDEADRIFDREYRNSVFGLFRSWHNRRSLEPEGAWRRFTLIMAYSAETSRLIANPNESPFNVGTETHLADFTPEQVADLNERYDGPLQTEEDVARLIALVGGQPFLVRRCLYELKTRPATMAEIEAECGRNGAFLTDHLERIESLVSNDPARLQTVCALLQGQPCTDRDAFATLRSCGVLTGDSAREARFRCGLYETYLTRALL